MQGTLTMALLGGAILLLSLASPLWARHDAEDAQLETVRKDIDKDWTKRPQGDRAKLLARQFNIDVGVIETLHAKKSAWGETTAELAMAQQLAQTDAAAYPTTTEALNTIESLRGQKMSWGRIARHLGFKLGPVISVAQHVRHELRKDPRLAKSAAIKFGKPEKSEMRPDSYVVAERVSRPERPERAARAR